MYRSSVVFALLLACTNAAAADHVLLRADFNSEIPDTAPGTGGAEAGEPIANDSALIGLAPLPSPNLKVRDTSGCCAQSTLFEFLGGEERVQGTVQLRANVLFTGSGQPVIGLREHGSSAQKFVELYTAENGTTLYGYAGTTFLGTLGGFAPGAVLPLEIDASAEQGLVSVRLGGAVLLDRTEIGLATERGIGRVQVGALNNGGLTEDAMRVDDLRVVACESEAFADCLLVSGFED